MNDQFAQLKAQFSRLHLLHQVSNVIHSTLDSRQALELIVSEAVRITRASSGSVVLINPTTGFIEIEASFGLPKNAAALKLRVGEGITGWVAQHGKPACVGHVASDPRYIMVRPEVRSELAVPLAAGGEVKGVLNVDSDRPGAFGAEDQELLQDLAVEAAKVIHNLWLYEQVRLKARLFEGLFRVGQTINSTLNLDDALKAITREACLLMETKMCSLLMLDPTREWLELRASYGAGPQYIGKPPLNVADSLLGIVVRRKKPVQVENVQISARHQNLEIARREGLVSLLSVPLVYQEQVTGVLSVYTGDLHSFSNEEIRILSALAELSAIAIEKARLYERVVDLEEQLRQNEKLSAVGLLAAEVAHEIRNPLTVMKMLYHSLDLTFAPDDPRAKDAQILGDKMNHLNKIVEQILDLSRTAEPKFDSVNVNQLIHDLALLTRHKLTHQQIQLVLDLAPELPVVQGDATQLEQAFLNLTLNAAEAMPNGGTLRIASRALHPKRNPGAFSQISIQFKDTGLGMSPDQVRRAFSSILSTTKSRGTGLGLAIVTKIIENHHGKIQVASRPGRGSRFRILLPVPKDGS